jgi:hypothetical protein
MNAAIARVPAAASARLRWRLHGPSDSTTYVWVLLVTLILGCAMVLVTTDIGSGDYGQWLMTARPYAGLAVPEYRSDGAVPPVLPFLLGLAVSIIGDPIVALRVVSVLILAGLALSLWAAARIMWSPLAGLVAAVLGLLVTGRFLELFAFGGLLQAAAMVWLWFGVAAFIRASRDPGNAWRWWTLGAVSVGLGAMTHMGTALVAVPTGLAVAVLGAFTATAPGGWRARARRLSPLAIVLAAVAIYWFLVLLPGSTDLARNPASLAYRGPDRLLEAFTSSVSTAFVAATGLVSIAVGTVRELRRRMIGPWVVAAAWTTITLGLVGASIATSAATDYPRFVTPVLAPLVVGAAGGLTIAIARAARWTITRIRRGTADGWSLAVVVAAIALSTPAAVGGFEAQASGYRLAAPGDLTEVAHWIDANLPTDSTILAPAREGKWLEGLTGRAALFSSEFRYSFRADEWQRSLAASTLLGGTGAVVNEFFFARFGDTGSAASDMRGLVVGANHGGEFVTLLSLVPSRTQVLDGSGGVLASTTSLLGEPPRDTLTDTEASVVSAWSSRGSGATLSYHQAVTLLRDSATLEVRGVVSSTLLVGGLQLELRPSSAFPATSIVIDGHQATLTFPRLGTSQPQLLVTIGGQTGELEALPDGGLGIRSREAQMRLLITDLTAAASPTMGLQLLRPRDLIDRYKVGAVVLLQDPTYSSRLSRMAALGFSPAAYFGPYVVLVQPR